MQNGVFDGTEMQKLLSTFFLPSFCWVAGFTNSQVQCLVRWIWPAASVWHCRQACVTSGPEAKTFCNSLNLVWSAVVFSFSGLGASGCARAAPPKPASPRPNSVAATRARILLPRCMVGSGRARQTLS